MSLASGSAKMRRIAEPDTITLDEIRVLARARFGDMIKGVVDPSWGNRSRGVDDAATRAAIAAFMARVVRR